MLTQIHWSWWLPTAAFVYLAVATYLALRRTQRWPLYLFLAAACLGLVGGVFYLFRKPVVFHSVEELKHAASRLGQIDSSVRLGRFIYWLAHPVAAIGAVGVIASLKRNPPSESTIEKTSLSGTEAVQNSGTILGAGTPLIIAVCGFLGLEVVIGLVSGWNGFWYPTNLSTSLSVLAIICGTVIASVFMIVTGVKLILPVIAALVVGLGFVLTPQGVSDFFIVAACIGGLSASILLIIRNRNWLCLGLGGIIISFMILFPHPPHF